MKTVITFLFALLVSIAYAQPDSNSLLLDSAKNMFKKERVDKLTKFEYKKIELLLAKVIAADPDNAEARYFLGYTYSRMNSFDGQSMIKMSLRLVLKASEQFETVIKLSPKYEGELLILDPYSKLTAEWGSLAMSYWHNNKTDSAVWAFREGKKRGGFADFILEINRKVLNACSPKAILVSSGDNFSFPLWYLQIAEGYRKDVAVIDVSLLSTVWYPDFLLQQKIVDFDQPKNAIDNLDIIEWKETSVTINKFTWKVPPSYYDQYILRGDRVFLSLLKQNKFKRDIYFTIGFNESNMLGLREYLSSMIVVDKLIPGKKQKMKYKVYKQSIEQILQLSAKINRNSTDEIFLLNFFRYNLFTKANDLITANDKLKAKELIDMLDKYANETDFPYGNDQAVEYLNFLRKSL